MSRQFTSGPVPEGFYPETLYGSLVTSGSPVFYSTTVPGTVSNSYNLSEFVNTSN